MVTPLTVMLMSPVFFKVTFCVPVVFSFKLPKLTAEGVACKVANAFSAVPARAIEEGVVSALEVMFSEAESLPSEVGANVIV